MSTLLAATAKGLVVIDLTDPTQISTVHFAGFSVNMIYEDERHGRWWAGVSHKHWGQKLHYSDDRGKTWQNARLPVFDGNTMPNGKPARLRQVWCMQHGGIDRPNELWLGTDPGALFRSTDFGLTFTLVESLWNHPSRQKEGQWFGTGNDFPFIHSIVVDPENSDHVYIAVSCAGVFETVDGGQSWQARNKGLIAAYLPNPNVEVGHDPHLVLISKTDRQVLWQQNHCGVFYSKDGGAQWTDVSNHEDLPNYGFALALDDNNPGGAWVIPVSSDDQRIPPDLRLQVYHTVDFGATWTSVSKGLPDNNCFDLVLRHSLARRGDHMVFGTTNGNLYLYASESQAWTCISSNLTKVQALTITEA